MLQGASNVEIESNGVLYKIIIIVLTIYMFCVYNL